jgi:hypothetical protein
VGEEEEEEEESGGCCCQMRPKAKARMVPRWEATAHGSARSRPCVLGCLGWWEGVEERCVCVCVCVCVLGKEGGAGSIH